MEANIDRVQRHLDRHGVANRPHIKTHKIPAIAKLQVDAGAVGIACQKVGEVEVFVDAGVCDDILLTFNIIGDAKAERLMALIKRIGRLAVVLDNEVVARGLRGPRSGTARTCGFWSSATPATGATACRRQAPPWSSPASSWTCRGCSSTA